MCILYKRNLNLIPICTPTWVPLSAPELHWDQIYSRWVFKHNPTLIMRRQCYQYLASAQSPLCKWCDCCILLSWTWKDVRPTLDCISFTAINDLNNNTEANCNLGSGKLTRNANKEEDWLTNLIQLRWPPKKPAGQKIGTNLPAAANTLGFYLLT